jgi:rSAM/selenodomain-associated transferase 2
VKSNRVSVIISTLNEEVTVKPCLESAKRLNPLEIIVVDGGSIDNTAKIAEQEGATVICSPKGRGIQMNRGASIAKGEILLFLHADTVMPKTGVSFTSESFNGHIGGFFKLKFDDNSLPTRLVELFANFRARLFSLPYGDQAMFIKKDVFEKVGGFREYPFLEDIDMALRIKKFGKLKYIPLEVVASSRRLKKGYLLSPVFVSLRNVVIALLFMLGVRPSKLAKLYK